jgi:hypothetical protein
VGGGMVGGCVLYSLLTYYMTKKKKKKRKKERKWALGKRRKFKWFLEKLNVSDYLNKEVLYVCEWGFAK